MSEPQYLYLTTIGRRSGQERQIEIWFTERAGRYYIIAEHGTRAQWVLNILANSKVRFRVGAHTFGGTARVLSAVQDGELAAAVQQLSRDKYGWGEGLVVELTPDLKQL